MFTFNPLDADSKKVAYFLYLIFILFILGMSIADPGLVKSLFNQFLQIFQSN